MEEFNNTKVIQITNIAPQATRDQMHLLFQNIGKIEDLRLYPSIRDASVQIQQRCCFLKFMDSGSIPLSLHMTNTVFIDRAIIVQPFINGDLPDEWSGLEFANASQQKGEKSLPANVTNEIDNGVLNTIDPGLDDAGLPKFPSLPGSTEAKIVEEIRRTVTVIDIDPSMNAQACVDFFGKNAGEVKYFRWCNKESDDRKIALLEFTDYGAVVPAMRLNDTIMGNNTIKVYYATQCITKPQTKSNEMAQKEIEDAMKKVKEAQNLVSDAVNPLKEWLGVKGGSRMTRSRTRSPSPYFGRRSSRRSRSRSRSRHRRRSRSRRRRSRSRSRRRRSKSRKRSRSRRRSRSRSRDRKKDRRSKSRDRDREKEKKEDVKKEKNGEEDVTKVKDENTTVAVNGVKEEVTTNGKVKKEESRSRSRSRKRSRSRRRSRSRDRRSKSRKRSRRSRSRKKRSRSRRRSRSRDRRRRSRTRSRSKSRDHKSRKSKKSKRSSEDKDVKKEKITRDYDAEEAGYENSVKEEKGPVPMEISNSP